MSSPHGRPTATPLARRTRTGFPCFARTSCDRGGCPLYSGDGGAHPDRSRSPASACRITATRPYAPPRPPSMRSCASRSINKGSSNSPVRSSPRLWHPDGAGALGLEPRASHPAITRSARRGGDRPSSTSLKHALRHRHRPSLQSCVFTQCVRPRVATKPSNYQKRQNARTSNHRRKRHPLQITRDWR